MVLNWLEHKKKVFPKIQHHVWTPVPVIRILVALTGIGNTSVDVDPTLLNTFGQIKVCAPPVWLYGHKLIG